MTIKEFYEKCKKEGIENYDLHHSDWGVSALDNPEIDWDDIIVYPDIKEIDI